MNSINVVSAVPQTKTPAPSRGFREIWFFAERNYTISGITQDSSGLPLANVVVKLFLTATDAFVAQTVSDNLGRYSFTVDKTLTYYTVDYKAGPPDVYGTSLNTLMGA